MSLRRRIAIMLCHLLRLALPSHMRGWAEAVRREVAGIDDDGKALLFASGSLCGLTPRAIAFHLLRPLATLLGGSLTSSGVATMGFYEEAMRRPRAIGLACAIGAIALGLAYMAMAGAPIRYLGINAGALIIGMVVLTIASQTSSGGAPWRGAPWRGAAMLAIGVALLATALFGLSMDGASRWVKLGSLPVQPSLILLPVMIVGFASSRGPLSTIGMAMAALALALQPDRAMAGMLFAGLTVLAIARADRWTESALAAAGIGFVTTLMRADTQLAMPYVDQILYSAFDTGLAAGLAVSIGSVLLVLPAIAGSLRDEGRRETYWAFGAIWLAAIAAAALGNYPTPLVGYSGSAVLGYLLSLLMLPKRAAEIELAVVPAGHRAGGDESSAHRLHAVTG